MATIIDVIDNFFTHYPESNVADLPGHDLWRFGEEVQRFSAAYDPPHLDETKFPIYLSEWPWPNFFVADQGKLVLSTLLYSGQVLAKDPLSDWFAYEQYQNKYLVSDRQGYLNANGTPNLGGTRQFLANMIPALRALAPLITSGAIVLVPGEQFLVRHQRTIDELRHSMLHKLIADTPEWIIGLFRSRDRAVNHRRRGAFVLSGGNKQEVLSSLLERSLLHFSREWLLAQAYGAEYVARGAYEQFLCEEALGKLIGSNEHQRTVNALFRSRLPVFQGLNPRLVADIREDPTFAEFRAKLFEVYRGLPGLGSNNEFMRYLDQVEEALLRPVLERAEREAGRGFLYRLGIELTEITFSIGARAAYDATTGDLGMHTLASEGIGVLADRVRIGRQARTPLSVWTKLYRHHRKVADELRQIQFQPGSLQRRPWEIDEEPSTNLKVSPSLLLFDDPPLPERPEPPGYREGDYRPCDCGQRSEA